MAEAEDYEKFSLNKIEYECNVRDSIFGPQKMSVVYLITKDELSNKDICYISGVDMVSTTVTSIRKIVKEICLKEKRDLNEFRFIDVLTFPGIGFSGGHVIAQELNISEDENCDEGLRTSWLPADCPDEIKKIFIDYARFHQ